MSEEKAARILVTGGSGQVGGAIVRLASPSVEVVAPGRGELDLLSPAALAEIVQSRAWTAVVNCAAYTGVDKAETDVVAAWQVNALAPAALADATRAAGIPIIHLSTDYVFDGSRPGFYTESDPVSPIGIYGASKEGGEQAVRTANPRHVILRTAWVVSATGNNFVKTMLRLGSERPELRVVADQWGCPTSADDIARAVLAIATSSEDGPFGTYHFVNSGEASWHELAEAVFARAAHHGRPRPSVAAIATSDYPTPAARPANSRLSTTKIAGDYGIVARPWQTAVEEIVDSLIGERV
jgi:dTDP-4-dehydrorhamnose reductase